MNIYEKYMRKCFKLAKKGEGRTSPNPLVGCVILDKDNRIISTGYHKAYGKLHAEADALSKISDEASRGSTLIVNLEPCSHYGKQPPCSDLIIKRGVKRLIIGMKDPNPLVSGRGIVRCKSAGIEIIEGILEKDAYKLNEIFVKNMVENKIFVALKTATTLDGNIATQTGSSKWITSEKSRQAVQVLRNRYDAILTTSQTVLLDNPSMTCRMKNGKNPIRIILDRTLRTDVNSEIYKHSDEKVYVVTDKNQPLSKCGEFEEKGIGLIKCSVYNKKLDVKELFEKLYALGIRSVLTEAGGGLNGELLILGLVDKIYHFIAPKILCDLSSKSAFYGRNIKEISDSLNYKFESITDYQPDYLITYVPVSKVCD